MPELVAVAADNAVPLLIHYVWVGGPIPGPQARHDYRAGIAAVATAMPHYQVSVWLSRRYSTDDEAYTNNLAWCAENPVQPRNIDTELMLQATERTALEKQWTLPPRNYGAISDVVRVAILDIFGGIYLDTDCRLTAEMPAPFHLPCRYGFAATRRNWNSIGLVNSILASVPGGSFVRALRNSIIATYQPLVGLQGDALFAALRCATALRDLEGADAERQRRSAIEATTLRLGGPTRLDLVADTFRVREIPADPQSALRPLHSHAENVWQYPGVQEFIIPHDRMQGLPPAQRDRLPLYGSPLVEFHNTWLPPPVPPVQPQPPGDALAAPVTAPVGAPTT